MSPLMMYFDNSIICENIVKKDKPRLLSIAKVGLPFKDDENAA